MGNIENECVALIPARSGSKSIVHKNIQSLAGKPLMCYSIETAQSIKRVKEVFVSTDSRFYADIARRYGANAPFLRPRFISSDDATDKEVIEHFLFKVREVKDRSYNPIILFLRPTHPMRDLSFLENLIEKYESGDTCMFRTVSVAEQTPYKMWTMNPDSSIERVIGSFEDRLHDSPRQKLPQVFWQDGYADVFMDCALKTERCRTHKFIIKGVISPKHEIDVDYPEQLIAQETLINSLTQDNHEAPNSRKVRSFDQRRYGS
jgi:CMP-N,N'-diacetyllegionaminic acid synthase